MSWSFGKFNYSVLNMKLKPVFLSVIQEEVDGTVSKEFFHEMSDSRLHELINGRTPDGAIYYSKGVRDLALLEVDRRQHNSLVSRVSGEIEFREEVVKAMVNAGISRHVAENMTSEESKMMQQAKKYGII